MDANPNANPARQVLQVPSSRRQVDVQANQTILTELAKNLEMAKISLRNETPLIQIVDRPILPLKVERLGKIMGFLIGTILAGFLICVILILREYISKIMNTKENE